VHNFDRPPPVSDPYDYRTVEYDPRLEGYVFRAGPEAPPATDSAG
jgi:hypothetical protein